MLHWYYCILKKKLKTKILLFLFELLLESKVWGVKGKKNLRFWYKFVIKKYKNSFNYVLFFIISNNFLVGIIIFCPYHNNVP